MSGSPDLANGSRVYTMTTALAAAFNILVLLVICFVVMPRMEYSISQSERTRKVILENRHLLEASQKEIQEQRAIVRRLSDVLDAAVERQKAMMQDMKRPKSDGKE